MVSRMMSLTSAAALITSLAGCGLIFSGSRQAIQVQSSPAAVFTGAELVGLDADTTTGAFVPSGYCGGRPVTG